MANLPTCRSAPDPRISAMARQHRPARRAPSPRPLEPRPSLPDRPSSAGRPLVWHTRVGIFGWSRSPALDRRLTRDAVPRPGTRRAGVRRCRAAAFGGTAYGPAHARRVRVLGGRGRRLRAGGRGRRLEDAERSKQRSGYTRTNRRPIAQRSLLVGGPLGRPHGRAVTVSAMPEPAGQVPHGASVECGTSRHAVGGAAV